MIKEFSTSAKLKVVPHNSEVKIKNIFYPERLLAKKFFLNQIGILWFMSWSPVFANAVLLAFNK